MRETFHQLISNAGWMEHGWSRLWRQPVVQHVTTNQIIMECYCTPNGKIVMVMQYKDASLGWYAFITAGEKNDIPATLELLAQYSECPKYLG